MFDDLFSHPALLFTVPALLGTAVFLLKLGLVTIGGVGADVDLETDMDIGLEDAHDSTGAFQLLSLQTIAAFLMGFGWFGLGGMVGLEWPLSWSIGIGVAGGAAMVWLMGLLFKAMYDLQSSGNIDINDTVGIEGSVYAGIPAKGEGRGQVRLVVDKRARIYNAVSDGPEIARSVPVRVTGVGDDRTLTVTAV